MRATILAVLIGAALASAAEATSGGPSAPRPPAAAPPASPAVSFAPSVGKPAVADPAAVADSAAAADLAAWRRAMDATRSDWTAWTRALNRTARKLYVFRAEYRIYRSIAAEPDSARRLADARRVLGWDEDGAADRLVGLVRALDRLESNGFPDTVAALAAGLESLQDAAAEAGDLADLARGLDPAAPEDELPPVLRRPAELFRAGRRQLDPVRKGFPRSAALVLWGETWDEAAALYTAAGDRLTEAAGRFPREPLCGDPGRWTGARRAFLRAAPGREGLADCRDFLLASAYPGIDAPVWESAADVFLYDPATREGFLLPRDRAETVRRYRRLLVSSSPGDAAAFAADAGRVGPEAAVRADTLQTRLRRWGARDRVLFAALGGARPLAEALKLSPAAFRARALLDPGFAARAESLTALHEDHAYVAGWVMDARTQAPLSGASVTFAAGGKSASDRTDAQGRFGVAFPGAPGRVYRGTVSLAGYQAVTETGVLPARLLVDRRFQLNPAPEPFVVLGRVYHRGSRIPVRGAEVTAGTVHGTVARSVTGIDGAFRLIVQAAQNEALTVRASRLDGAASTRLTVLGPERRGVDLVIDLAPTAETAGILAPPGSGGGNPAWGDSGDEASASEPVSEDEEPPPPTVTAPGDEEPAGTGAAADTGVARHGARFIAGGPPLTRTTASGGCRAGVLRLELPPHAFPPDVSPGGSATLKVTLSWTPEDAPGEVRIMVRAFFFDAPAQNTEVRLTAAGSRTVSFTFPTDTLDLSGEEGTAGVGAGLRVDCGDGTGAERVVSAYQAYRRNAARGRDGDR